MKLAKSLHMNWDDVKAKNPDIVWKRADYAVCESCGHIEHWHYAGGKYGRPGLGGCCVRVGGVDMGGKYKTRDGLECSVMVGSYCGCKRFVKSGEYRFPK